MSNNIDTIKLTGRVVVKLNDAVVRDIPNLVVTVGKEWLLQRINSTTVTPALMSYIALGNAANSPTAEDTQLASEIAASRAELTWSITGASITYTASWFGGSPILVNQADNHAIAEAGIFNDVAAGTMLARTTFAVVNKGASDALTITWTISI